MESEEITKLVDGVYKNILEKFNPGARQLITAGKGYLKALHGAASASRMFNEALCKIAMNAQQSGTGDIGSALLNVVSVYKEIQDQQMNILKAFYVDLLVPLETNLEKDTKVVQHEQKKFMQQHKVRMESYHKAMSTMKKHRKKKNSPENTEKELRSLQMLEDQKKKLDVFCEQSYKHAMTQERRRYGFVLERQCSIAKHWVSYHNTGKNVLENNVENWQEVASSREIVTATAYENNFAKRMERIKEDENHTGSSMLKKARSVDAPYGDMRTLNENNYSQNSLPRAKSDFNLTSSNINGVGGGDNWDQRPVVKSLYAYMPSGENQLPFAEGDKIALVGKKANGWQFGENLRTQMFGWFPIAYTNAEIAEKKYDRDNNYENLQYDRPSNGAGGGGGNSGMRYQEYLSDTLHDPSVESDSTYRRRNNSNEESSPTRMFGDTIMFRNQKKYRGISGANPRPGPPPTLPAPVPSGNNIGRMLNSSQSFCSPNGPPIIERRKHKNQNGGPTQGHVSKSMLNHINNHPRHPREGTAKTSLHSSNDSGFANEPPPQPEVDYSDEEHTNRVPIRRKTDASFKLPREIASWTLSRSFRNGNAASITDERNSQTPTSKLLANAKQSISFDNIVASDDEILQNSSGIKRTKSFWKFGKNDDILAGMSLWQHRDLVPSSASTPIQNGNKSGSSARIGGERKISLNGTLTKSNSNRSIQSTNEQLRKDSVTSTDIFDDDENIYGIAPQRHHHQQQQQQQGRQYQNHHQTKYTPPSRMKIMKTIEIDIENPMEPGERVNTIKRDHRGTVSAAKQSQQQQQQQHQNIGNGMKKATSSKDDHQLKQKSTAAALLAQSKQSKMKLENELTNSSDDDHDHDNNGGQDLSDNENDDDDNGTLKMSDVNNFFEDMSQNGGNGGIIMKTVKRRDILKQYYTSEEDESEEAEVKSTSSDPYDCIVINDHLVRKDDKNRHQQQIYHKANNHKHNHHQHHHQQEQIMEFQTFRSVTQQQQQKLKTTMNNKNANNGNGSMNTKFNHSEQDRYNGSTLTRGGSSTANTSASTAITTATSTNHGGGNSMMMITPTATILPRTRLMKSSMNLKNGSGGNITTTNTNINTNTSSISHTTLERNHKRNGNATTSEGGNKNDEKENKHFVKTYGPWYDFWEHQDQLTSSSVKSSSTMPKSKMLMK